MELFQDVLNENIKVWIWHYCYNMLKKSVYTFYKWVTLSKEYIQKLVKKLLLSTKVTSREWDKVIEWHTQADHWAYPPVCFGCCTMGIYYLFRNLSKIF